MLKYFISHRYRVSALMEVQDMEDIPKKPQLASSP
jgi:hypothetical protein